MRGMMRAALRSRLVVPPAATATWSPRSRPASSPMPMFDPVTSTLYGRRGGSRSCSTVGPSPATSAEAAVDTVMARTTTSRRNNMVDAPALAGPAFNPPRTRCPCRVSDGDGGANLAALAGTRRGDRAPGRRGRARIAPERGRARRDAGAPRRGRGAHDRAALRGGADLGGGGARARRRASGRGGAHRARTRRDRGRARRRRGGGALVPDLAEPP